MLIGCTHVPLNDVNTFPKEICWNEEIKIKYIISDDNFYFSVPNDYQLICDDEVKIYDRYYGSESYRYFGIDIWNDNLINKEIDKLRGKICFSLHTELRCKIVLSNGEEIYPK